MSEGRVLGIRIRGQVDARPPVQGIRLPKEPISVPHTEVLHSPFSFLGKNDQEQKSTQTKIRVQENDGSTSDRREIFREDSKEGRLLNLGGSEQRGVREDLDGQKSGLVAPSGLRVGLRADSIGATSNTRVRHTVVREPSSSIRGITINEHARVRDQGQAFHTMEKVSPWFHVHAHSMYSINDALPSVKDMVATAVKNGQTALALTDHGAMGGLVQLYKECNKAGIQPYPGCEMYLVKDRNDPKAKRYHVGIVAFSTEGYQALVKLGTRSHTRENFHFKPLIDFTDLAEWHEYGWTQGLALTTGCYFGLLIQTLVNDGEKAARYVLERYANLFPHTFVELQNHNIERPNVITENDIAVALVGMADELGLPVLITQDSHYCDAMDKTVHEVLKRAVAFGPDPDDAVFPGDSYHLAPTEWVRAHHENGHWLKSDDGFAHLRELHSLAIPELDHYSFRVPTTVPDPMSTLQKLCRESLDSMPDFCGQPKYEDRLAEELAVLRDVGFAGYLLVVKTVTDWCAENHVFTQTRGSACGSLVCWLLGITQINPIRYSLSFEQFISRDRGKPPDVDLDVEDTRRADLLEWLKTRFSVQQIGNYGTYSINDDEKSDSMGRGSLIVAYKKIAKARGVDKDLVDEIKSINDIPEPFRSELLELSERKVYKSYGTHAAGLVVTSTNYDVSGLVPMMFIASANEGAGRVVTAYNDDDIEALGLVKLDVLGLRTLSLLRCCVGLLGRDVEEGLDWIPLNDTRTFTTIRRGDCDGVFQLEGYTARRGCRELKVRSLKDIIVIMALYRPGVSQASKDLYLARRNGVEKQPQRHPILMRHLEETFGISLFQEQVIAILRDLGMDPESLTDLLKAVKASQKSEIAQAVITIAGYQQKVSDLCRAADMSDEDFRFLWEAIEGFAKYGFKRAHATAYGLTAYRCAYLRTNHPLEFATALLKTSEGSDKEPKYVSAVRKMGISILSPHINISGPSYSIDRAENAVRRGLVSVKGIGIRTAEEIAAHAPYDSISQIIERCKAQRVNGGKSWDKERTLNGHLGKLLDAGVLYGLKDLVDQ